LHANAIGNKRHEFIIASHKHSSENYKIINVQTSI